MLEICSTGNGKSTWEENRDANTALLGILALFSLELGYIVFFRKVKLLIEAFQGISIEYEM